jgi:hypothetical protein
VNDETTEEQYAREWQENSAGDTRKVFNFGIGSLLNHASVQTTLNPETPESVSFLHPGYADDIRREFNYCYRYVPVFSVKCTAEVLDGGGCPRTFGAYFEMKD